MSNMSDQERQERADEILHVWQTEFGGSSFQERYERACELVFGLWKVTAKSGCKGMFHATLRRMNLARSTAYDMVTKHRILIGELEDPDAGDARDDEEAEDGNHGDDKDSDESEEDDHSDDDEEDGAEESKPGGGNPWRPGPPTLPKKVVLELKGKLATAVAGVQNYYQWPTPAKAITGCVLRVWDDLKTPLAKHHEPPANPGRNLARNADEASMHVATKLVITKRDELDLRGLGYTEEQIYKMKPEEAEDILSLGTRPSAHTLNDETAQSSEQSAQTANTAVAAESPVESYPMQPAETSPGQTELTPEPRSEMSTGPSTECEPLLHLDADEDF